LVLTYCRLFVLNPFAVAKAFAEKMPLALNAFEAFQGLFLLRLRQKMPHAE